MANCITCTDCPEGTTDEYVIEVNNVINDTCTACIEWQGAGIGLTAMDGEDCVWIGGLQSGVCSGIASYAWLMEWNTTLGRWMLYALYDGTTSPMATYEGPTTLNCDPQVPLLFLHINTANNACIFPADITATPVTACSGGGGGDPHFFGFEGDSFEFQGMPDKTYNLISDTNLSLNGTFGDYKVNPGTTYIKEIGLRVGSPLKHTDIYFSANGKCYLNDKELHPFNRHYLATEHKYYQNGFIEKKIDKRWQNLIRDKPFILGSFQDGLLIDTGTFILKIGRFTDSVVSHLDVFAYPKTNIMPHGIIGQTADGDNKPRKGYGKNGEGAIEGVFTDYEVDNLFGTEFKFSRWNQPAIIGKNKRYMNGKVVTSINGAKGN